MFEQALQVILTQGTFAVIALIEGYVIYWMYKDGKEKDKALIAEVKENKNTTERTLDSVKTTLEVILGLLQKGSRP